MRTANLFVLFLVCFMLLWSFAQVGGERSVSYAVQVRTDQAPWVASLAGEGQSEASCSCRRSFTDFVSLHEQLASQHPQLAAQLPKLPGALTLDVVFVWDRVNRPNARADGTVPGADDFRTTVGLGWSF